MLCTREFKYCIISAGFKNVSSVMGEKSIVKDKRFLYSHTTSYSKVITAFLYMSFPSLRKSSKLKTLPQIKRSPFVPGNNISYEYMISPNQST